MAKYTELFTGLSDSEGVFVRSDYSDIRSFFDEASKNYDSDLVNPYWSFTHEILKFILQKFITEHFDDASNIRLFDAGAGTGNWSKFVLGLNDNIRGVLFDMNSNMLKVAYPKVSCLRGNHVEIMEGNLEIITDFPSEKSNLILCMHNVVGLARNTQQILRNLYMHLDDEGLAFVMAMNKCHALDFTRKFCRSEEVSRVLLDGTVKFKPDMPEMFCYTPSEFQDILYRVGFDDVMILGFPITVSPNPEDTKLLEKRSFHWQLKNIQARAKLLELEKQLCLSPELAYRGKSSLIAICKKSSV